MPLDRNPLKTYLNPPERKENTGFPRKTPGKSVPAKGRASGPAKTTEEKKSDKRASTNFPNPSAEVNALTLRPKSASQTKCTKTKSPNNGTENAHCRRPVGKTEPAAGNAIASNRLSRRAKTARATAMATPKKTDAAGTKHKRPFGFNDGRRRIAQPWRTFREKTIAAAHAKHVPGALSLRPARASLFLPRYSARRRKSALEPQAHRNIRLEKKWWRTTC